MDLALGLTRLCFGIADPILLWFSVRSRTNSLRMPIGGRGFEFVDTRTFFCGALATDGLWRGELGRR